MSFWDRIREPRIVRGALIVLAVLLLTGIAGTGGWAWYRAAETRSRHAFAGVATLAQKLQEPGATAADRDRTIQALEVFIQDHSRSSSIPQAAYRLGNLRYEAGQYGPARGAFELALAKGAAGTLRTLCAVGVAYTWESEKDYARADTAYQATIRTLGPKDFMYEELLTDLARVQELAGDTKAAADTYQRLLREVPDTRRADDIRSRLAAIESRPQP